MALGPKAEYIAVACSVMLEQLDGRPFSGTLTQVFVTCSVVLQQHLSHALWAQQDSEAELVAVAGSAADARVMLEALEVGTAGALLRTNDPQQARSAHASGCRAERARAREQHPPPRCLRGGASQHVVPDVNGRDKSFCAAVTLSMRLVCGTDHARDVSSRQLLQPRLRASRCTETCRY